MTPAEQQELQTHLDQFKYFWLEKGDPTRFTGWKRSVELFRIHRPDILERYEVYLSIESALDALAKSL